MRWILWSFLLLIVGVPLAAVGLVAAALDDRPAIVREVRITPEQTARAKQLLKANDPRTLPPGVQRSFTVSAEDIDLGLNFLLSQRGGASKVALSAGTALFWVSVPVPGNPFGSVINVEAMVRQTASLPEFDRLKIGAVSVPGVVADWLLQRAILHLEGTEHAEPAADVIKGVRIEPGFVQVAYEWREDLPERLRKAVVSDEDQARLKAYQERLVAITGNATLAAQVSMSQILKPLLALAAERSVRGDPAAENRAALAVLAFYVNGRGLAAVVPQAKDWPRPVPRNVTISQRHDFAQHFSISAAVAAAAGTPLANAIGIYKEVDDSRGGSGFSFTDIAADRAGTVFGEQAAKSAQAARALQQRVSAGLVEADFMPQALDLPEGLAEAEFKHRYGGVDTPRYREVMQVIERRLAGLALYR